MLLQTWKRMRNLMPPQAEFCTMCEATTSARQACVRLLAMIRPRRQFFLGLSGLLFLFNGRPAQSCPASLGCQGLLRPALAALCVRRQLFGPVVRPTFDSPSV